jgi:hypothetical protein
VLGAKASNGRGASGRRPAQRLSALNGAVPCAPARLARRPNKRPDEAETEGLSGMSDQSRGLCVSSI